MSVWTELFARCWHVGIVLTPLLLWAAARRRTGPRLWHGVATAVLVGLVVSAFVPVVTNPGAWIEEARRLFRDAGLAPCLPREPVAVEPDCFASRAAVPWAIGMGIALAWHVHGCLAMIRLRQRARPADDGIRAEVAHAADHLGARLPQVQMHRRNLSPMVTGWWHPVLLLPETLWQALDPDARAAILLHELAHVRRRDVLTQSLGRLAGAIFWWHPAVWRLRHHASRCAELASDALATRRCPERAPDLARALLTVQRFGAGATPGAALPALSAPARDLVDRMEQLLGDERGGPSSRQLAINCLWVFALALALGWLAVQVAIGR